MNKNELKIKIQKKLNSEYIGQGEYFRDLSDYFIEKIDKNEKGILLVAGQRNTFKKVSIRTVFEELNEENLINNKKLEEIDLSSYNFNLGYNAFLTDLYEILNSKSSDGVIFKNTEQASKEIINLLSKIYPNSCIKLKNRYKVKNKFFVDAEEEEKNTINEIVCHNKFFVFIYNYEGKIELTDFVESSLNNVDKVLYTRELTEKEKNNIIRRKLNNEIDKIKDEYGIQLLLGYKEDVSEKEKYGVGEYLQESFRKKGSFAITEYIKYKFSNPVRSLIEKEKLSEGEKLLIYVENNGLRCKVRSTIYNMNKYSIPTLEEVKYKLESIIGLKELKEFLLNIENNNKVQKIRERLGLRTSYISLNMIFAGNAGTGKTNAARITYEYLYALGLLSKGILVEVSKADFITENINETSKRTNDIINSALGGVLFIDEAYSLFQGENDKIGKEIVDSLIKGIEDNRNNLTVILAGYEKDMEEFLSINQGLKSRFPNIIHFEDYTPDEMYQIAIQIAKSKGYRISKNVKNDLIDLFIRNQLTGKNDLGNARFVRNIIENAIIYSSRKYLNNNKREIDLLEREDFNFKANAKFDLEEKLKNIIGLEEVKDLLRSQYKLLIAQEKRKSVGVNTEIEQNLNMVFVGNPGTGKTSIARLVAEMLNSMGLLKIGQLVECDRSSFVSNIPGETAKKTEEKFKEALGGILFIDEAYTLANDNLGKEAIETLLKLVEDYSREVIVILAGYEEEMEDFFDVNIGLRSRFPLWTNFEDYNPNELLEMAIRLMESKGFKLSKNGYSALKKSFIDIYENSDSQSGNGRMVRNYVENLIRVQSIRIAEEDTSVYEINLITAKDIEKLNTSQHDNEFDLEKRLDNLVGNEEAKEFLRSQYKLIRVKEKRKKLGLSTDINRYMNIIFTGEIGTGKKTVLNIFSETLYCMGIVKTKNIVEINKDEAIDCINNNTSFEEVLNKQIGKVIYIDGAEFLLEPYSNKIIKDLIKFMDKNSNNSVLTLSGKEDDIRRLMYLNPELNYRFSSMLNFKDYSKIELINMTLGILQDKGYILEDSTDNELTKTIGELYDNENLTLKNALMVKQYLDILIREQSIRICDTRINNKEMNVIVTKDLIKSKEKFIQKNIYK
ncbi:AAA family ATPase [Clostridium sp. AL.422]|uniref:AAA family ATPase n=1 Tax=Clostridium TaxID=1485 RepID=UPI00293DDF4C|nr:MULTISPECIES: AAA family ATPase [unclassified Clostridium]MDV4151078.1 AAA family ATPase [Clostridium sp. AL.422]